MVFLKPKFPTLFANLEYNEMNTYTPDSSPVAYLTRAELLNARWITQRALNYSTRAERWERDCPLRYTQFSSHSHESMHE
jgi:hypothetical protein